MASTILCIEIGPYVTRVIESDYKVKNPKVQNYFSFETPDGTVGDGSVQVTPDFIAEMKKGMTEKRIHCKKAIFVVNSVRIANRDISLPLVKDNKIHDLLMANASEYFPVDLQQYQLIHHILEKNNKEKKLLLSVVAVPKDIIASYHKLASELGVEMEGLDYAGNSMAEGMKRELKTDLKVAIKIDEMASILTIINGDKIELQRNITYGISDAIECVMESSLTDEKASFADAVELMRRKTLLFRNLDDEEVEEDVVDESEENNEDLWLLRRDATESLRGLVGNIGRILDYYAGQHQNVTIEQIFLLGLGADISRLSKLLTNELNIKVKPMDFSVMTLSKRGDESFRPAEYFCCIGAVYNPMKINYAEMGTGGKGAKKEINTIANAAMVFGVCVVISVGLAGFGHMAESAQVDIKNQLITEKESLQPAQVIYDNYVAAKTQYDDLQNMYNCTRTANDGLLNFLEEMEMNMPSEIVVSGFSAGESGVTMSVAVDSKEAAADVMDKIRLFTSLSSFTPSGIVQNDNEEEDSKVNFSITAVYAPHEYEDIFSLETEEQSSTEQDSTETDSAE